MRTGMVITRVSDVYFELGEILEFRGNMCERPDYLDSDPICQLHDLTNPERVILAVWGDFQFIPDDELLSAAVDPMSYFRSKVI